MYRQEKGEHRGTDRQDKVNFTSMTKRLFLSMSCYQLIDHFFGNFIKKKNKGGFKGKEGLLRNPVLR